MNNQFVGKVKAGEIITYIFLILLVLFTIFPILFMLTASFMDAKQILEDEEAVPEPKDFNLAEYSQKVFRMFGKDDETEVELLCETGTMNGIVDQFGTKVKTEEIDDQHFQATVTVCPSPTFYRWVFGWNGGMKIIKPDSIKKEYKVMLRKALEE